MSSDCHKTPAGSAKPSEVLLIPTLDIRSLEGESSDSVVIGVFLYVYAFDY